MPTLTEIAKQAWQQSQPEEQTKSNVFEPLIRELKHLNGLPLKNGRSVGITIHEKAGICYVGDVRIMIAPVFQGLKFHVSEWRVVSRRDGRETSYSSGDPVRVAQEVARRLGPDLDGERLGWRKNVNRREFGKRGG